MKAWVKAPDVILFLKWMKKWTAMWGILTSWEAQSELAQGQGRDLSELFGFFLTAL